MNGERLIGETRDTSVLVDKHRGACHKSFATGERALAFVEVGMAALQLKSTTSL